MNKIEIYRKLLSVTNDRKKEYPVHETHKEVTLVGGSNGVYYIQECPCLSDDKECKCHKHIISGGGSVDDDNRCPCSTNSSDVHCDCYNDISGGSKIKNKGIQMIAIEYDQF